MLGRVLAEEIRSPRDIPGFDNSAMDGYAVRAADIATARESRPVSLKVIETVGAGTMPTLRVEPGTAIRTMTGAPIAAGADAIIQVERTRGADSKSRSWCRPSPARSSARVARIFEPASW